MVEMSSAALGSGSAIRSSSTLVEYAAALEAHGRTIFRSSGGTLWIRYETGAMMRLPAFSVETVHEDEIKEVFWRGRAALVTYLLPPDERHAVNSWLYVCTDRSYGLDKLAPAVRRNVHRGLKELRVTFLTPDQLLAHGVRAFCDTRRRNGLNDGTAENFRQRFASRAECPGHVFLGVWRDDELAGFLSIGEVDAWAEIEGSFSVDSLLYYRPNDTLFFHALSHYLTERKFRLVSYGLSSVQTHSNAMGLHAFKIKVGFEARPVHRRFEIHPALSPFVNRTTLWLVKKMLFLAPQNRRLKKAEGMLTHMLRVNGLDTSTGGACFDG